MSRNGSGVYALPAGNPVVALTVITPTWANTTLDDIANELTNSIDKGGRTVPTANLPMGGFKHTNAGDANAAGQYLTYGQATQAALGAGGIAVGLGAVGTPTYSFTGDLNTGFWSPGADILAVSTGGIERVRITDILRVSGTNADAAASGSAANGAVRLLATGSNIALDQGASSGGSGSAWLQARDSTSYASTVALLLNPVGGNVGLGTTVFGASNNAGVAAEPYANGTVLNVGHTTGAATGDSYINFRRGGVVVGSVKQLSSSGVTYSSVGGLQLEAGANLVALNTTGELGIGVAAAAGIYLDIQKPTGQARIQSTAGANAVLLHLTNGAGTNFVGNDTNTGSSFGSAYSMVLWQAGPYSMLFATNNTKKLELTSDGRLFGTALHNNGGAVTGATNQYIASGTYTPTQTSGTNVTGGTPQSAKWIRVGNVVTVSGYVSGVTTTAAAATPSNLRLTLPIASALALQSDLNGSGVRNTGGANDGVRVVANTANDGADLNFYSSATGTSEVSYQFSYEVL